MQIKLPFGLVFTAVLNKAPYSFCANPHIGVVRPQRGGLMLRFPPEWPIWNIEVDAGKRRFFASTREGWERGSRIDRLKLHWGWR